MSKKIISLGVVSLLVFSFSMPVSAQIKIVPDCAASGACTTCDFLALAINLTEIIGYFAGTTSVVMLIIGCLMWILGGANENLIDKGKKLVVGTFTGLIIVFFAWTIVNFLIYALAGGSLGNVKIYSQDWWNPNCSIQKEEIVNENCSGDGAKMGARCKDAYHFCYGEGLAIGGKCTDSNPCTCVDWCMYTYFSGSAETYTCVSEGGTCPTGYDQSSANTCGEAKECCLKYVD